MPPHGRLEGMGGEDSGYGPGAASGQVRRCGDQTLRQEPLLGLIRSIPQWSFLESYVDLDCDKGSQGLV